jgi:hypothetical protein
MILLLFLSGPEGHYLNITMFYKRFDAVFVVVQKYRAIAIP